MLIIYIELFCVTGANVRTSQQNIIKRLFKERQCLIMFYKINPIYNSKYNDVEYAFERLHVGRTTFC